MLARTSPPLVTPPRLERFPGHEYPQVIPDPDEVRPGGAAPWASLTAESRRSVSVSTVVTQLVERGRSLESGLPELSEELKILSRDPDFTIRPSAVLVALLDVQGEAHVVLTRRSLSLRHHRGEIALPGGRRDGDEDAVATALREANEEIGLDPSLVSPVALLSPIASIVSNSAIWPVVGTVEGRPRFQAQPGEVDRVFSVALADLLGDDVFVEERWRRSSPRPGSDDDGFFPIYFFRVPGDLIWGATARVLVELLAIATGVAGEDDGGLR